MYKLTVVQLKEQLCLRGLNSTGNKTALLARLRTALENEGVDPERFSPSVRQRVPETEEDPRARQAKVVRDEKEDIFGASDSTSRVTRSAIPGDNTSAGVTRSGAVFSQVVNPSEVVRISSQVDDVQNSVRPCDSASQVSWSHRSMSSRRSSVLSSSVRMKRAEEAANRAGLLAKATVIKERQRKEEEELRLRQEKEKLDLEAQIEEAAAREEVFANLENTFGRNKETVTSAIARTSGLDANASTFQPRLNHDIEVPNVTMNSSMTSFPANSLQTRPTSFTYIPQGTDFTAQRDRSRPRQSGSNDRTSSTRHVIFADSGNTSGNTSHSIGTGTTMHDSKLMETLVSYNLKSLMPKAEVQRFGGDNTQYRSFIRSFESVISSKLTDEEEKLFYLEQYTTGKPREIVRACLHMSPGTGYQEARRLLEKRYGNHERIVAAYMDKILEWPNLKADDIDGLDQFSVMLISCKNAILGSSLNAKEIEHPKTMRVILEKLPFSLHERWRRLADTILEDQYRQVTFTDLVEFIEKEARVASNPLFGRHLFKSQKDSKSNKVDHSRVTNSKEGIKAKVNCNKVANEEGKQLKCFFCSGKHYLDECQSIMKKSEKERKEFIVKEGLCFGCLRHGHVFKDCQRRRSCRICNKRHVTILHRPVDESQAKPPVHSKQPTSTNSDTKDIVQEVNVNAKVVEGINPNSSRKMTLVPVKVTGQNGQLVQTYAFIDFGSDASFCSTALLNRLKCGNLTPIQLSVSQLWEDGRKENSIMISDMKICDVDESSFISMPPVYTVDKINVSVDDIVKKEELQQWPQLCTLDFPDFDQEIGLMIGNNVPQAMEPYEVIHSSEEGGPFAIKSKLGWLVFGSPRAMNQSRVHVNRTKVDDVNLDLMLTNVYNREFQDLSLCSSSKGLSGEDRKWLEKVEDSCAMNSCGHYEISMPFRDNNLELPSNRNQALKRLENLKRKFLGNDKFYNDYCKFMTDMIDKGQAEIVTEKGAKSNSKDKGVWYIPHHGVYHPHKPDKVRVVFDCAAKCHGTSLNDLLLQGPDLSNSLLDVLIKFRDGPFAFTADIESMFYQVSVPVIDRDYLRFLWWPEGNFNSFPKEYRMTVHLFGASSSPSCANYALHRTAKDSGGNYAPEVSETILGNFYVDDCLKSAESEEKLVQVAHAVKSLCGCGGFNLTKFVSNSKKLLESLPVSERGKSLKSLDLCTDRLPMEKVLGLSWDVESDSLKVAVNNKTRPLTKRGILSTIGAMYDPLGMVAPYVLQGRLILQDLCKFKIGWDDDLPSDQLNRWTIWKESLPELNTVSMHRNFNPLSFGEISSCQLHHFADASEIGYGTVSYIRMCNSQGDVHCSFVFGKSHVAPLKTITIPRLELTAATLSVKVNYVIQKALNVTVDRTIFWTDSTTVLRYIGNDTSRFHTFVANRIAVIHDGSSRDQWRYVPSSQNPADDASRGIQSDRWLKGPDFLHHEEGSWPQPLEGLGCDTDLEIKTFACSSEVTKTCEENSTLSLVHYHSSWIKLVKSVAWILRIKRKLRKQESDSVTNPFLTIADYNDAKKSVIHIVQQNVFSEEIIALEQGNSVKKSSPLFKLHPVIHDCLLRIGGRLRKAPMSFDEKHPIILPYKHHVTDLIIRDCHERVGHQGREHVLSSLREQFWIIKGNAAVRKVLRNCIRCRRNQSPVMQQQMSDLPVERVTANEPPFTYTGVDCFGPFYTKKGRSQVKRYGVLFTCLTIRAIHIEVADSMSTDSFINALRRFIARRGQVKVIRCDRGTNFVSGERELREAINEWNQALLHQTLLAKGIDWYFNPPHASHFGGIWERQIRTVRKILVAVLKEQTLTDDSLVTLMCEIEAVINSRPLTTVSSDYQDLIPLTPNNLLTIKGDSMIVGKFDSSDVYCKRRWRHVQYLADVFWSRWRREYLSGLQIRQKWNTQKSNLKIDDVVIVVDEASPRCHWSLGRVVKVNTDTDGLVRSATVKCGVTLMERPLSKLVLLCESET